MTNKTRRLAVMESQIPSPPSGERVQGEGERIGKRNTVRIRQARSLRQRQTATERALWARVRNRQVPGAKFRRQYPVGFYIADFCCTEHRLIIELDGGHHAARSEEDRRRTAYLEAQGYRVLRFWDNEVLRQVDAVLEQITKALSDPHPSPLPGQGEGD